MMRQMRWIGHMVGDKIVGLVLLSVTAYLASKAHHPTANWGTVTGVTAGLTYQLIAVLVYVGRFGPASFRQYNAFFYTMFFTLLLGWIFGDFAVRKQCLQEKQPCTP